MIAECSIQHRYSKYDREARARRRQRAAARWKTLGLQHDALMQRLRSDQDDEDESFLRGIQPIQPERRVLAVKSFAVDIAKLPRLQPHVVIDPLLLDDDE